MITKAFKHIHVTRDGVSIPVLQMENSHILNMISYTLTTRKNQLFEQVKRAAVSQFAPENMSKTMSNSLGLKQTTQEDIQKVQQQISDAESRVVIELIDSLYPYIIVGLLRQEISEKVRKMIADSLGFPENPVVFHHIAGISRIPSNVSGGEYRLYAEGCFESQDGDDSRDENDLF